MKSDTGIPNPVPVKGTWKPSRAQKWHFSLKFLGHLFGPLQDSKGKWWKMCWVISIQSFAGNFPPLRGSKKQWQDMVCRPVEDLCCQAWWSYSGSRVPGRLMMESTTYACWDFKLWKGMMPLPLFSIFSSQKGFKGLRKNEKDAIFRRNRWEVFDYTQKFSPTPTIISGEYFVTASWGPNVQTIHGNSAIHYDTTFSRIISRPCGTHATPTNAAVVA